MSILTERAREIADTTKGRAPHYTEETIREAVKESDNCEQIMMYLGIHGRQIITGQEKDIEPLDNTVDQPTWSGKDINEAVRTVGRENPEDLLTELKKYR